MDEHKSSQRPWVERAELANHDHGTYAKRKQQVVILDAEFFAEFRLIIREECRREFREAIQEFQDRRGAAAE